jgi:hypothetical protein
MKHSFRMWCQEKWFEHKDELEAYQQPLPYTAREYFNRYKFWLKREYKHQQHLSK